MDEKKQFEIRVVKAALVPQAALVLISIIWIWLSPKDHIGKYIIFNTNNVLIGLAVGTIIAFAGYGYYLLAKKTPALQSTVELFETILAPTYSTISYPVVFALSIIAGICEEGFFRGLLFNKIGIIPSSVAFGLLHLPGLKYWIYALWAFLSAVIFCNLLIYTGSLITPIVAHATNNIIGMILLKKLTESN